MAFFTFHQNNSRGVFIGPHCIIIEAKDEAQALEIAEKSTEIYFDGCDKGRDCEYCGDRWSRYCTETPTPQVFGEEIMQTSESGKVYYLDGTERTF